MKTLRIVQKKNSWFLISIIIIAIGFGLMVSRVFQSQPMLNFGIDFTGGTSMMLRFEQLNTLLANQKDQKEVDVQLGFITQLRGYLAQIGLEKSVIQVMQDQEVLIKTMAQEQEKQQEVLALLRKKMGEIEVLEIDFIGPTIGDELRRKSWWIIIVTALVLLAYIAWRFQWRFGVAALSAVLHDALVTLSFASMVSIEINVAFVAAILTILGYSINDTIVVFDRIRENSRRLITKTTFSDIIDLSLTQTLMRTINTSITTMFVIIALILSGGPVIRPFCMVLLVGIVSGTYSSMFVAAPLLDSLDSDVVDHQR